jgi:hypothetical protein
VGSGRFPYVDDSIVKPGPSETVIGGAWTIVDGKVQGDAAAARIQELVAWHLQVVAADSAGWATLAAVVHVMQGPHRQYFNSSMKVTKWVTSRAGTQNAGIQYAGPMYGATP